MSDCCGKNQSKPDKSSAQCPLTWFGNMIQNCYNYATKAKSEGKRIVGIMCEYTPS